MIDRSCIDIRLLAGAMLVFAFAGLSGGILTRAVADPAPMPVKHFVDLPLGADGQRGAGTYLQGVHRIVCLGDSITQWGDGPKGYVGIIRTYLTAVLAPNQIEVINAGIAGNTVRDEFNRFNNDVLAKKPDLLTISVGVNDVWHGFDATHPQGGGPNGVGIEEYRTDLDKMVTEAQKGGARVVLFSTTVIQEDPDNAQNAALIPYNQAIWEISRKHGCLFVNLQTPFHTMIDIYRTTGGEGNFLAGDGVHMNDFGNQVMAETILSALLSPMSDKHGRHD